MNVTMEGGVIRNTCKKIGRNRGKTRGEFAGNGGFEDRKKRTGKKSPDKIGSG